MRRTTSGRSIAGRMIPTLLTLLAIALFGAVIASSTAMAQDIDDPTAFARQVDKNIRAAERDMFNGKNESADEQLKAAATQIEQLRSADPENGKLKSLQSMHDRIRKNLDRKLGVNAKTTSSSGPAAPPKPSAPAAPAAASKPAAPAADDGLPRAVQGDLGNARNYLDEAEAQWAADHSGQTTVSGATDPREVKLDALSQPLSSANYYYESILKKCQRQSSPCDPGHPEIAALKTRIDALEANVATLKAELADAAAAEAAEAAEAEAQAEATLAECVGWGERFKVYTDGDKALYRCVSASPEDMPACKSQYDEAAALLEEFNATQWAEEPCDDIRSTMMDLGRYMANFEESYAAYEAEHAAALEKLGKFVFSKQPIDPNNPSGLTDQFAAGDHIYGLIQTTVPWSEIYGDKPTADVMVNVTMGGEKIHAQFVKIKSPQLMGQQHLVFEVAPDPSKMTAYGDPNREYGSSTATMRQGPNELTHELAQLGPGEHTVNFDITYFGTTWAAGSFTISGSDFSAYADLHERIAKGVAGAVTLPPAKMTDKAMAEKMKALLENAGWEDIHRINIVDKDWWLDRVSGGDSMVKSRHIAAAALARDGEGYYYKVCTFHQDRLLSGGFGELYLSHQGDRVPVPEANIDK